LILIYLSIDFSNLSCLISITIPVTLKHLIIVTT